MMRNPSIDVLHEKLEFFRHEEAITSDPEKRSELHKRIEEVEAILAARTATLAEEPKPVSREARQPQAGDVLLDGRLRLLEPIGRGGFAEVWKACDSGEGNSPVAVKVLHGQYAKDRTRRERFFRGARQMARLRHRGIIRIFEDECKDAGLHFFVMEHAAGGDLHRAVLEGSLKREEALQIVAEAGKALQFAHEHGVNHGDVKPSNILLDEKGRAKLTDFNLVGAADTTGGTRTGMLGTVIYAAPEAMEKPQEPDALADIFGLGMTALFAIYGDDLPLEVLRDTSGFMAKLDLAESLRAALLRAVAWRAKKRWTSVADFYGALSRS